MSQPSVSRSLSRVAQPVPQISIVVPCYNEAENVAPLVEAVARAMAFYTWEMIFVDDNSPDGTIAVVRAVAANDSRVRGIRRIGRRGLSSAVIEGALSSSAPIVAVMDGDLQHDEACLVPMVEAVSSGDYDLAVASRHLEGGGREGLANNWRRFLSQSGTWGARYLLNVPLTDPMSGFFVIGRDRFDRLAPSLSGKGFKILLDLVLTDKGEEGLRVHETPMAFRPRHAGQSKLGADAMVSFARLVALTLCLRALRASSRLFGRLAGRR